MWSPLVESFSFMPENSPFQHSQSLYNVNKARTFVNRGRACFYYQGKPCFSYRGIPYIIRTALIYAIDFNNVFSLGS
jgi:hypothetical protein